MALTSTSYTFDVDLSDVDRGCYAAFTVRLACHPSETDEHLLARLLAYMLEYEEGVHVLASGLSTGQEPSLWIEDLTGRRTVWIDVGTPDPERVHRASKASDRVAIYCHKDPRALLASLEQATIFARERVTVTVLDRASLAALATVLERRTKLAVTVTDGTIYIDVGGLSLTAPLLRCPLG
jgi:uncharacterized protein YaeQ